VHFVGGIQDTKSILDQTDIFALASHAEPFGLVIPEAREAGCAVVATEVDGIPEALDGGKAGLLVPVRDPRALAEALGSLLDDRAALEAMKAAARQGLAYWSVDRVAEDTRRVYRELVGAGR
jgi:glycosyltransferase involved in cell wall biosynthesis